MRKTPLLLLFAAVAVQTGCGDQPSPAPKPALTTDGPNQVLVKVPAMF